jgi:predicted permease
MLRDLAFRLRALFRRGAVEQELDDELDFHLARQAEKYVAAGLTSSEAMRRARLELGGVSRVKQECRDARGVGLVEDLVRDVRYALRQLRKSPAFTATALLTLALGIGANTALFSVVNGVLLSPLPYPDPHELVTLHAKKPQWGAGSISFPNFRDWRAQQRAFAAIAIHRSAGFSLTGTDAAEWVEGRYVSAELFSLLGVQPVLGRSFARGEDEVGAAPVALISARLWQRKYSGARDVLGQPIILDGNRYTIVGVVPADFELFQGNTARDVYLPIGQLRSDYLLDRQAGMALHGIGRLKPGVTIEQARADMDRVTGRLAAIYPEANRDVSAAIFPFKERVVGDVRPILLVLAGAVGIVLLIACVNVANLLLARATGRSRELAIRMALGASRPRLVTQLLTESAVLALVGGGLGLLLAGWVTPSALALLPDGSLPRAGQVSLDGRVLAFCVGASLLCAVLFGLAPALRATDRHLQGALKDGGRGATGARHRFQDALIVIQVAMVLVLLVGAGLMIRTLLRLSDTDPGFDPEGVTTSWVSFPPSLQSASPDAARAHFAHIESRLAAIPGVEAVSLAWSGFPMQGVDDRWFWLDGKPRPASTGEMTPMLWYVVGPGYRRAMGLRLLRGRFLEPRDRPGSELVVVADDAFVRESFGTDDPLGKRVHVWGLDRPATIVGVVGHVKQMGLAHDGGVRAQLYFPIAQVPERDLFPTTGIGVAVRSGRSGPIGLDTIRTALQELHPDHVLTEVRSMDEVVSDSVARQRIAMVLLTVIAGLALLLASIGIYGVISYSVGQQIGEIGIRMALGAREGEVLRMVMRQGLLTALIGIAIGVAAALALTRLMAGLLYGVSATDPLTFAAVAAGLAAVAAAACYLPARRAARVDPMIALRHD